MNKVVRDGKVAVLISCGHGAGWFSWNPENLELLFHPEIVKMVESGKRDEITDDWVLKNIGIDMYAGGACGLEIVWLNEGNRFIVEEYDGHEYIRTIEDLKITA